MAEADHPFPRSLQDGTAYVSPSQVKEVNACGARYEWKYEMGNTHPEGEGLHVGKLTHELVEAWANDTDAADDPLGHASQYVRDEVSDDVLEEGDLNAAGIVHEAVRLLDAFLAFWEEQDWTVVAAEEELIDKSASPAFKGYLDLLVETDRGLEVLDIKTAGSSPSYGRAREKDAYQATEYGRAKERQGFPIQGARLVYLVRNKTAKVVDAPIPYSEDAKEWAASITRNGVEKIRRGDYAPNPFVGWKCSPDRCGRWSSCPGAARWREDDEDGGS